MKAMKNLRLTGLFLLASCFQVGAQNIYTFAGNGINNYSGDNGPALQAEIAGPSGLCIDAAGNVYVSSSNDGRVRKINTSGIITTIAGDGTGNSGGDGGPATMAGLYNPGGLAKDGSGNLYIADIYHHRIRKVDNAGIITTFAGTGNPSFGGDGGPATAAYINTPVGVAVDAAGNVYIADSNNNRIRKVDASGTITTVAGIGTTGSGGDNGPATSAQLWSPRAVKADMAGNIYIAEIGSYRVRKVNTSGIITTIAGNGTPGYSGDGGPASSSGLVGPLDLALDAGGNIFINDAGRIRKINASGIINTIAGTGITGYAGDGGPALAARFDGSNALAIDASGNIYIADFNNARVREICVGSCLASVNEIQGSGNFDIYPNPVTSTLNFNTVSLQGIDRGAVIRLQNSLGQVVLERPFSESLDVSPLAAGVYHISITTGQKTYHSKFVKQ